MKDLSAFSSLSKLDLGCILTDRHLHSSMCTWTHTHFLCICLFLYSLFKPLLLFSVLLYDNVDRNILNKGFTFECNFPLCITLNVSTLRQQFQWDQWSWAMLQSHSSQPGTQQDLEDQRPERSASYTSLPCRSSSSITVRNMIHRVHIHTQTFIHTVHSSTFLQTWIFKQNCSFPLPGSPSIYMYAITSEGVVSHSHTVGVILEILLIGGILPHVC